MRSCYVFDKIDCLRAQERSRDLKSSAVIASDRTIKGKTTLEHRFYIISLPADAARPNRAVRTLAGREQPALSMDVVFGDDRMRARRALCRPQLCRAAPFRLESHPLRPVKRKGGLKVRRLIAATPNTYRTQLLGLG